MGIYSWKRENDLNLKINTLLFLVCFILVIIGSFEKKRGSHKDVACLIGHSYVGLGPIVILSS